MKAEDLKRNYYALLIAIATGCTAKEALIDMGISPEINTKGE